MKLLTYLVWKVEQICVDLFNPGVIKRQAYGQISPGDLYKQSSGIAQHHV